MSLVVFSTHPIHAFHTYHKNNDFCVRNNTNTTKYVHKNELKCITYIKTLHKSSLNKHSLHMKIELSILNIPNTNRLI